MIDVSALYDKSQTVYNSPSLEQALKFAEATRTRQGLLKLQKKLDLEQSLKQISRQKKSDRPIPAKPSNPLRYKTEMCRAFEENMICR